MCCVIRAISDGFVCLNVVHEKMTLSTLVCRIGLQIQMVDLKEKNRFEELWLKLGRLQNYVTILRKEMTSFDPLER